MFLLENDTELFMHQKVLIKVFSTLSTCQERIEFAKYPLNIKRVKIYHLKSSRKIIYIAVI
jgi:hypothetical protein